MNIPNTKEKLLNMQFQNIEELAETLYFYAKRNYTTNVFLKEILDSFPNFHITAAELERKMHDYHHTFQTRREMTSQKLTRNTFIRQESKNLYAQLKNVSQNKVKKSIISLLCFIIKDISEKSYKLYFTNEVIENLINLLSDEEHLKNEFYEFQTRYLSNLDDPIATTNANLCLCIIDSFSDYYCDYFFDKKENLKNIKDTIHSIMTMPIDELSEYSDEVRERNSIQTPDNQDDHTLDSLKQFYPKTVPSPQKRSGPLSDENITQTRRMTLNTILQNANAIHSPAHRQLIEKTIECYHDYFHCESDSEEGNEMLQFYLLNVMEAAGTYRLHSNKETRELWKCYLINSNAIYQESAPHPCFAKNDFFNPIIENDFFLFLAHSLMSGKQEFTEELMHYCLELINTNPKVSQNYTDIMNNIQQNKYHFNYPPNQMYECIVVASIIYELDSDKTIAKDLRHLLIKHYQYIYDNLQEYNSKGVRYSCGEYIFVNFDEVMNQYAIMFLLSYFKDPVYITAFSPLILQFAKAINRHIDDYYDKEDISIQKKNDYEKKIDELISKLKEDCDYQNSYATTYAPLFKVATNDSFTYDNFDNCSYMIEKYKKELAHYLSFELEDICDDFDEWDFEDQVSFLWDLAVEISFVQEIYVSRKYLPSQQELSKESYQVSLEETIQQQKEDLHNQDLELEKYKAQMKSFQRILKKENTNNNKEITKSYNKEISNLNKQLVKQNERIEELEEHQQELFKLRELMFELQNEQDNQNINDEFDYSSHLLELTRTKKIVCIGGHINLISALKNKYPNLIFITNKTSVAQQVIHNADEIFFFYNFLNHSLYYKIMGLIRYNFQGKWDYISSRNIALVERDMYNKLTS